MNGFIISRGWRLNDLPLRTTFSPARHWQIFFTGPTLGLHPKSISRDALLAQARAFYFPKSFIIKGVAKAALHCAHGTNTVLLCAFCEQEGHLATLRSLQAFLISPHRLVTWSILDCARRTSTFLSCAFREQEDDQVTSPTPTDAHSFSAAHLLRLVPSCRLCRSGRISRRLTAGHRGAKPFR